MAQNLFVINDFRLLYFHARNSFRVATWGRKIPTDSISGMFSDAGNQEKSSGKDSKSIAKAFYSASVITIDSLQKIL